MADQQTALPLPLHVQPLADFTAGQGAVITSFTGGRKLQERMVALGLFPGQRLTVCQNNGSSLVVKVNGNRLALGRGVSHKILATPTPSSCHQYNTCHCPVKGGKNLT